MPNYAKLLPFNDDGDLNMMVDANLEMTF